MKYIYNNGGWNGNNLRLFTDDGEEIGHFYPCDGFDPDSLGWIEIVDLKADAELIKNEITDHG
jgi:hypothetical protein